MVISGFGQLFSGKLFLRESNRGSGQSIRISFAKEALYDFIYDTKLYKPDVVFGYNNKQFLILDVVSKALVNSLKSFDTDYCFGYGVWRGNNRKSQILDWYERVDRIKDFFKLMLEWNIDFHMFDYIHNFRFSPDDKLITIDINQNGERFFGDIEKLINFLEVLGYESKQFNGIRTFQYIDVAKLTENKLIWDFIN